MYIDEDTGIEYADSGPWRSYHLTASGNTLEELLDDATVSEVDQDGDELSCYSIDDAPTNVRSRALKMIENLLLNRIDIETTSVKEFKEMWNKR